MMLMNGINEFSPSVIEKLDYYVYLLIDPDSNRVFYVGKGIGNRIFDHLKQAVLSDDESEKLSTIRAIHEKSRQVKLIIHRHGLTEKEAYEVESALIDLIGLDQLTNIVAGYHSYGQGSMTVPELVSRYDAPSIDISEPAILIFVNQLYKRGIDNERLYEITRGNWVMGERRNKAKYAFSVYNGIVRQVYEIQDWFSVLPRREEQKIKKRWRFNGFISQDLQHYVGGSVEKYITRGAQNPIKYVNC